MTSNLTRKEFLDKFPASSINVTLKLNNLVSLSVGGQVVLTTKLIQLLYKCPASEEEVNSILNELTDEEIWLNQVYCEHPLLHQAAENIPSSFKFLQIVWQHPRFKQYWDNPDYLDKYGFTAFQRLSIVLQERIHLPYPACKRETHYTNILQWCKNNMHVIPAIHEVNIFYTPVKTEVPISIFGQFKRLISNWDCVDSPQYRFHSECESDDNIEGTESCKDLVIAEATDFFNRITETEMHNVRDKSGSSMLHILIENISSGDLSWKFQLVKMAWLNGKFKSCWNEPFIIKGKSLSPLEMLKEILNKKRDESNMTDIQNCLEWIKTNLTNTLVPQAAKENRSSFNKTMCFISLLPIIISLYFMYLALK